MKNNMYLGLVTILYFALGFINIHFALLGFLCMSIPIFILLRFGKKTWCQGYCPRACMYSQCGKVAKKWSQKTPNFFVKGPMKWILLLYFLFGMTMMTISTIAVANGKPFYEGIVLLIFIPLGKLPQLLTVNTVPWLFSLSYSFYSFMFTATVLGLIMALIYRPRTWCTVCPIATISDVYIKGKKTSKEH